jgi:hypothetical protein
MTYSNPHLRIRWTDIAVRFFLDDVEEFVERMRQRYPEMVLFARSMHFRPATKPESYVNLPIKLWNDARHYDEDPYLEGGMPACGIALRVPWPEDIIAGDLERLIGGRQRKAYEDDRVAYRRFGRTVYFGTGMNEEIVCANREAIAEITGAPLGIVPEIRFLKHHMSRVGFEILYDIDDPDMAAFVAIVRQCLRGLGATTACSYDVLTGEPVHSFGVLPESKRWLRRCAQEEHLYSGPASQMGNRVLFMGPPPLMLKKWRLEVGLPYGRKTDPKTVKKLDRIGLRKLHHEGLDRRLPDAVERAP